MRKSINNISSQISSDPPDISITAGAGTFDPRLVEAKTRKEWRDKAQAVVRTAKAETADIVERYDAAIKHRHKAELESIYTTLLADLGPLNETLEQYMTDYMIEAKEGQAMLQAWYKGADAIGEEAGKVEKEVEQVMSTVIQVEKKATEVFDRAIGRIKKPRKTDDTIVPSDME